MEDLKILKVRKSPDFEVTGEGTNENWAMAKWVILPHRGPLENPLTTKAKILYSETGIYFFLAASITKSQQRLKLISWIYEKKM